MAGTCWTRRPSRSLRRQLGYIPIVPGLYTDAGLRGLIAKARGPVGLRSIYGDRADGVGSSPPPASCF